MEHPDISMYNTVLDRLLHPSMYGEGLYQEIPYRPSPYIDGSGSLSRTVLVHIYIRRFHTDPHHTLTDEEVYLELYCT
jgi:hypothetical protein